jgi:hypothetical protein
LGNIIAAKNGINAKRQNDALVIEQQKVTVERQRRGRGTVERERRGIKGM